MLKKQTVFQKLSQLMKETEERLKILLICIYLKMACENNLSRHEKIKML